MLSITQAKLQYYNYHSGMQSVTTETELSEQSGHAKASYWAFHFLVAEKALAPTIAD